MENVTFPKCSLLSLKFPNKKHSNEVCLSREEMWNVLLVHLCYKFRYLFISSLSVHFATFTCFSVNAEIKKVVGTSAIYLSLKSSEKASNS